ncbi:6-aminohexanoate-cyclic-dimer hydrolase domain protein [Mycobacterium xenopi 3993]|nr:6-aminohexanoate-cyclic-dimer hydrolase domain protein [Mycobacterium xenopi 3993]
MRIDPPPSLACANGTRPLATAAAAPPLDPPGDRLVSHGLWVGPQAIGSVVGTLPSSGCWSAQRSLNPRRGNG